MLKQLKKVQLLKNSNEFTFSGFFLSHCSAPLTVNTLADDEDNMKVWDKREEETTSAKVPARPKTHGKEVGVLHAGTQTTNHSRLCSLCGCLWPLTWIRWGKKWGRAKHGGAAASKSTICCWHDSLNLTSFTCCLFCVEQELSFHSLCSLRTCP